VRSEWCLFLSFAPPKERNQRKGVRNRAEGELGEAKRQPCPFCLPATQGRNGATKKGEVRTFSGSPMRRYIQISKSNSVVNGFHTALVPTCRDWDKATGFQLAAVAFSR
jgi:hypothetical protein